MHRHGNGYLVCSLKHHGARAEVASALADALKVNTTLQSLEYVLYMCVLLDVDVDIADGLDVIKTKQPLYCSASLLCVSGGCSVCAALHLAYFQSELIIKCQRNTH